MAGSSKLYASFDNNRNNGLATAKAASTLFEVGQFLTYDGSGGVIPVGTVTDKILGLSNRQVTAASADYALTSDISVSTPVNIMDYLTIPVTNGDTSAFVVGTYVDIDVAGGSGTVDSATAGTGTQILIVRVLDLNTIRGAIALKVA